MTFYNNYSITLGFSDETIIDRPGDDIVINLFDSDSSNLKAHVYVSNNVTLFDYLGILSKDNFKFDLSDINYNSRVTFIKLHFFPLF